MWGFFGSIVVGWMQIRKASKAADALFKAAASLFLSSQITFWFVWGSVGGAMMANGSDPWVALVTGFFSASVAMALAVLAVYRRHPELFGRAPISIPQGAVEELQEKEDFTTITPGGNK